MNKRKFTRNTLIYFLLLAGYIFLYVIDVKELINPTKEKQPKSKVEFIYQQF